MSRLFRPRTLAAIVMVLILSAAVYAFAAASTVPATTYARDGSGTISGFTITNVSYTLHPADPANVSATTFNIAPTSASDVHISLDNSANWTSCTNSSGSVSCSLSGVTAAGATMLRIVAAD
ncbi:MAG: hypothetical protein MUO23_08725 [Anaerolineales bacterium]|nr:hypothetical protein [Anaerolineales bacterium]